MTDDGPDPFTNLFEAPAKFARALFAQFEIAGAQFVGLCGRRKI